MRIFFRILSSVRRHGPTFAREFAEELGQDQFKEHVMGVKRNLYTGLPTRGGIFYSILKEMLKSTPPQEKLLLVSELESQGVSKEGAKSIVSGSDPASQADIATLLRLVKSAGFFDPSGSVPVGASPATFEAFQAPPGEVYNAAMMSMNRADE